MIARAILGAEPLRAIAADCEQPFGQALVSPSNALKTFSDSGRDRAGHSFACSLGQLLDEAAGFGVLDVESQLLYLSTRIR